MSGGSQYVVAAYAVIWFLVLAYVVVLGARTARIGRQVEAISRMLDRRDGTDAPSGARGGDEPVSGAGGAEDRG